MSRCLVDTCGWIEWLTNGTLAERFSPYLAKAGELIVPTAIQFELYKWVKRERGEAAALKVVGLTAQSTVVPLDTPIALTAGDYALEYGLSFADALIYAHARKAAVPLITSDDHFRGLPGVEIFAKGD
ncbi:MAG: type II toxin-antitoxin system VapC family toxin [Gammaproteobacteria bacterium]|nr:type II toxin-antitoxin system VapC family toxin [Gammaproteobacteria bacterium]